MANHPSAEKRNRQRLERAARNRAVRSAVRTALKHARTALDSADSGQAKALVHAASVALAHAAAKGVLHARTASRATSRIQSALHKLVSGQAG
jgi:small subunit ribosomal protein S20